MVTTLVGETLLTASGCESSLGGKWSWIPMSVTLKMNGSVVMFTTEPKKEVEEEYGLTDLAGTERDDFLACWVLRQRSGNST